MTAAVTQPTDALTPQQIADLPSSKPIDYGRWVLGIVAAIFIAAIAHAVLTNDNINYGVVREYFFSSDVLRGLWMTIVLSVLGMVIGTVLGAILTLAKLSGNPVLATLTNGYIWFFRGIPLLVQMLIWGNFALLFPTLGIGIPFTEIMFFGIPTNSVITIFIAATLALALHEAAYMAEVIRGGVISVGHGQHEACEALGLSKTLALRRILLPQATRVIIPPTGNQFITLLKASSMVSVIAGGDLLTAVQDIASVNYRIIELLLVASAWYMVVVSILSIIQYFIEKKFSKSTKR